MNDIQHKTITKAVFPIAGLETRFLPTTKVSPKEMLPIVDKPLIQYAVEEAYAVGIRQMILSLAVQNMPLKITLILLTNLNLDSN